MLAESIRHSEYGDEFAEAQYSEMFDAEEEEEEIESSSNGEEGMSEEEPLLMCPICGESEELFSGDELQEHILDDHMELIGAAEPRDARGTLCPACGLTVDGGVTCAFCSFVCVAAAVPDFFIFFSLSFPTPQRISRPPDGLMRGGGGTEQRGGHRL